MADRKLSDFKRYHKNPRKISDQQLKDMEVWIRELGDLSGIVVDIKSGEIIAGNQRSKVAKNSSIVITETFATPLEDGTIGLGYIQLPNNVRMNYREVMWTKEQCERANIIANKAGGSWDFEILETAFAPSILLDTGFGKEELDFIANEKKEVKEDNFKVVPPLDPISRPGDIYELNNHKLQCGDSTKPQDIQNLMAGEKARLVFTDPPYGVSYDGAKIADAKAWEMIKNDELRGDGLFNFLSMAFAAMHDATMDKAAIYCFYASRNHIIFESALNDTSWVVKQQLIWSKGHVLGRSDYHWCHEPILYGCKEKDNSEWFGDRTQRTVILQTPKKELRTMNKQELIDIISEIREETAFWEIKRDAGSSYEHPTQKPVALAGQGIMNSSLEGDIVLDPFAGAGFVLLAAEQLDRKAYLQEFDPKYVDVIVKRWTTWMQRNGEPIKIKRNGTELTQEEIDKYLKDEPKTSKAK